MSGREEWPDERPVEWPLDLKRPLTIQEEIKRFVRSELSQQAADAGFESLEESDDFEVPDDDPEYISPYELSEMQEDNPFPAKPEAPQAPAAAQPREQNGTQTGVDKSTTKGEDLKGGGQLDKPPAQ